MIIVKNEAECVRCGHILQSLHVHDYRTHSCHKSIWFMVDGGNAYVRRGWGGPGMSGDPADHYIERSIDAGACRVRGVAGAERMIGDIALIVLGCLILLSPLIWAIWDGWK